MMMEFSNDVFSVTPWLNLEQADEVLEMEPRFAFAYVVGLLFGGIKMTRPGWGEAKKTVQLIAGNH
jgi:hypothetical protein